MVGNHHPDFAFFPLVWVVFAGLCSRIQEEEWDKYIVPSKTESEKYKVSRTFSFLMNRMTSTRNKYKVIWDSYMYYYLWCYDCVICR